MTDLAVGSLSSNWKRLQQQLKDGTDDGAGQPKKILKSVTSTKIQKTKDGKAVTSTKRKLSQTVEDAQTNGKSTENSISIGVIRGGLHKPAVAALHEDEALSSTAAAGRYLAVDCEMVGITERDISVLARVSIVNFHGAVLYDVYVEPPERVTNWRTAVSGIRPRDMANAKPLHIVQQQVRELFKDRIIVGHALKHDLRLLSVYVPNDRRRDTARHAAYLKLNGGFTPSLKFLAKQVLGQSIQTGEHDSVVDARTAMELFKHAKKGMEENFSRSLRPPLSSSKSEGEGTQERRPRKGPRKKRKK